jgi:uncharacterized protein YcfL
MKLGVLGIVGLLLLTGCASSPSLSVEDQTKLIEYENCLSMRRTAWLDTLSASYGLQFRNSVVLKKFMEDDYLDYLSNPKWVLELCAKYRP